MRTALKAWGAVLLIGGIVSVGASDVAAQQLTKEHHVPESRAGQFISSSSVAVVRGDFGTNEDTTITQLAETLKYRRADLGEVGLTVPYLFRDGGGVTPGEGARARSQAIPDEANGVGDLQLKGKYYWLDESDSRPSIDLTGRLKVPTASEDEGLGTGGMDVGMGTELVKRFGSLISLGDLELVLRDRPGGSTLHPVRVNYAVGVGYPITTRFTPYLFLDGSTPSRSGAEAPLELMLYGVYTVTQTVSMNGFLLTGLTDGSPDFGAGTGVTLKF